MGYYSEVKLITTQEGWDRLEQAVSKVRSKDEYEYWVTSEADISYLRDGKYILAEWHSAKWYSSFEDVEAFEDELYAMAEQVPFKFIRMGEDFGDSERMSSAGTWGTEYADMPDLTLKQEIEVEY